MTGQHITELQAARLTSPESHLALSGALDESSADRLLTPRELQVRDQVRDIVAHELVPRAVEVDRDHTFAHDSYQALAAAGVVGLIFPQELGGTADTNVAYAAAMEEISAGCGATSLIYMTQMHAGYPIWKCGTPDLAAAFIPQLLDGRSYGSLAITEPDAGSDAARLRTRAVQAGDTYRLSGSKTFITTGDRSDVLIVFATIDPTLGRDGITAFVVDGDSPGLTRGTPFHKMGMHGSTTSEVFLDNVEVPAQNILLAPGAGWAVLTASVVKSRISAAAQGVGIARAAYAAACSGLQLIHGRRWPDEITFAMADLRSEILRGRLLLRATAREVDLQEQPSPGQIGMMKMACTDLGWRGALEAARILGPFGDLTDVGVDRCIRDAKITQIYDGTNEIQRLLIGRDIATNLKGIL